MPPDSPAHEAFVAVGERLGPQPRFEPGTKFSKRPGLRVDGRIFACAALVAGGAGAPFASGGRQARADQAGVRA